MSFGPRVLATGELHAGQIEQVRSLLAAANAADGTAAVSEETELRLLRGYGSDGTHLLAIDEDHLVGYAGVDLRQPAGAELVVHPDHRRVGFGRRLLAEVITAAGGHRTADDLWIWAHGDLPGAAALAGSAGFARQRVLLQMRLQPPARSCEPDKLAEPVRLPEGVTLRTFRPGVDEGAWLDLNATAFADHPEQAQWTLEDLLARMAQPWFDPAGFLLAERDGALIGFHWTKIHEPADGQPRTGEIYVLGVDPAAHGGGLGRALVAAGLAHLRSAGLSSVMLYVDESNTAAVRLYTSFGFRTSRADVSYHRRLDQKSQ